MSATRLCPACGSEIPAGAPAGLCPKCLLQEGLKSRSAADANLPLTEAPPRASSSAFVPPTPADLAPRFPQLEILDLLGQGGMGAVYKARQPGLDRLVAVKILPPEISQDSTFIERFTREARALAKLSHPNIVAVYDFGQADGFCYFVMEYVDGVNLRHAIRAGDLKSAEALKIVPQICDALQFAHDEGIVHRDIKPENILMDKKGLVKIADFGLAKLLGQEAGDISLTGTNQAMGTVRYMAPEQMEGARDIDHRADIYSLGVVFYELLTGELPLGRFAVPSKKVQIDVRLDEIVLRALEKEPERRYQHASELKTEVEGISGLSPVALQRAFGTEFRSKITLFGIPLLHIAFGLDPKTGRKRVAKGIIAVGDVAIGALAFGGVAMGGVAVGGVSVGLVSLGGLSLGLMLAVGGLAVGALAFGGLALGGVALGGGAVGYYAAGGGGWGVHALLSDQQDPEAIAFFDPWADNWPRWIVLLALGVPLANVMLYTFVWCVFRFLSPRPARHTNPAITESPPNQEAHSQSVSPKGTDLAHGLIDRTAEGLWLAAALAFFVGVGLLVWLAILESAGNPRRDGAIYLGIAIDQVFFAAVLSVAGLLLRQRRGRMVAMILLAIFGVFGPAALIYNLVREIEHTAALIPFLLGMPLALWTVWLLFREDVRRVFLPRQSMASAMDKKTDEE
jgi:predicted Ser/Thr protein kinase